jgi:cytochrome c biogenesis protein ResB
VIPKAWRTAVRFLTSTALVTGLLVFVSLWSAVATFLPQGEASSREVAAWATAHPLAEPVVRTLGLHQAFTSWVFVVCVLVLGLSAALCSWRRTKVAIGRARTLRIAAAADEHSVSETHDLEIACDPALSGPEILSIASETLGRLGIPTKRRGDLLGSVSPWWSVWGSPVFHWGLLALLLVILVGNLLRSDGLMAVAVGQARADAAASYGVLHTGSLHDWSRVQRSIRVDAFEPDFKTGGIDRGPAPTVSVLDGAGNVIITQRVYPNMMLHAGSLSISSPDYGLAATVSLLDTSGVEIGRSIRFVDFSQTATDGTVPVEWFAVSDSTGKVLLEGAVTVPLDRVGGGFGEWIPKQPNARVVLMSPDGAQLVDSIVRPGEDVALPTGTRLRLVGIGWYARLAIVDDPTTPLLYAVMVIALLGLTVTVLVRQQVLVATVSEGPDGARLAMNLRLWRNTPTNRGEIEGELARALGGDEKGGTP